MNTVFSTLLGPRSQVCWMQLLLIDYNMHLQQFVPNVQRRNVDDAIFRAQCKEFYCLAVALRECVARFLWRKFEDILTSKSDQLVQYHSKCVQCFITAAMKIAEPNSCDMLRLEWWNTMEEKRPNSWIANICIMYGTPLLQINIHFASFSTNTFFSQKTYAKAAFRLFFF